MNFLAHAWLAGTDPFDRVGGVIGDFVKGPLEPPPAGLSRALAGGVLLHRRIDSFAETHPAFRASRARVSPARRRVAGIMVDMFYDHLLAALWSEFSPMPLERYAAETYALVAEYADPLPAGFAGVFQRMCADDWLTSYRQPEAIAQALDRMAVYRLRWPNPMAGGGEELLRDYAGFAADFRAFMADARAFAEDFRAARGNLTGGA